MITKSTSYKLVRRSDNQIVDEGSKKDMDRKYKPVAETYMVGRIPNRQSIGDTYATYRLSKQTPKLRKTIAKFNHSRPTAKDLLSKFNAGLPEASKVELARANKKTYEHYSTNGKGETVRVDPTPREGLYKTKSEGRIVGVMPKKREAKLKAEIWRIEALCQFLRKEQIYAHDTKGWFLLFKETGKMSIMAQLNLFMQIQSSEIEIKIDRNLKHLVIGDIL